MGMQPKTPFSRVFFIGAGFSAGMFYPVGRTLMSHLVKYLQGEPERRELRRLGFRNLLRQAKHQEQAKRVVNAIEHVLTQYFGLPLSQIDQVDVAEFFTMTHTLAEMPLLFGVSWIENRGVTAEQDDERPSPLTLFYDLAAVTRSYFTAIGELCPPSADIQELLRRFDPSKDAVVNFNWDEEADIALAANAKQGVSYTLEGWRADGGVLTLKPHGSVGWYDVRQGIGNDDLYFIADSDDRVPRAKKRILSYVENELPVDIDGAEHSPLSCPPVITPPTFAKRFEYLEQQQIWHDTLTVCTHAREFVFLGYSLPRDDFLTRAAIRSALREGKQRQRLKVLIVDRDISPDKVTNFQSVFGPGLNQGNNSLTWSFGTRDKTFAERLLDDKLKKARLLR
jgi:hypothetical protein